MVFGVPTMYRREFGNEAEHDEEIAAAFGRARLLVSGSAALPARRARADRAPDGQGNRRALRDDRNPYEHRRSGDGAAYAPGYVGRPLPGVEVRLVDDDGRLLQVSDDETFGEIAIRGENLFTGYLKREDATREAMHDGWFHTGDLATRAPDGFYRIVGRRSTDLIKSGGYRIGAGEIENALLEHPSVAEAAVVGVADDDLGERVAAWVVVASDASVTAEQLTTHVGRLLSSHKCPREIHFVQELPRNGMGKVMKKALE